MYIIEMYLDEVKKVDFGPEHEKLRQKSIKNLQSRRKEADGEKGRVKDGYLKGYLKRANEIHGSDLKSLRKHQEEIGE